MGSNLLNVTDGDPQYHFLLEQDGYLLNRAALAFVNVISEAEYSVRGHSGGWDRSKPATREYGAEMKFTFVNESLVEEAVAAEAAEMKETEEQDKAYREQIAALPTSTEKRVISFGLYGAKEKYTHGALRNAELAEVRERVEGEAALPPYPLPDRGMHVSVFVLCVCVCRRTSPGGCAGST